MANKDKPGRGARFETLVQRFFARRGLTLELNFPIPVGFDGKRSPYRFDLGSARPPVIVECKRHTWTATGNTPAAQLAVWMQACLYFVAAPRRYRRILAVLRDVRGTQSLAEYFLQHYGHVVPRGVEIWELAPSGRTGRRFR
jgi:hypothetical protein